MQRGQGSFQSSHIYYEETALLQSTDVPACKSHRTKGPIARNCDSLSCYDRAQADDEVHDLQANFHQSNGGEEKGW